MSDTPNTDAQVACDWTGGVPAVPYEFAQDQERHINSLETIVETQRQRLADAERLLRRVIEWDPALPVESGLADEIGKALGL